MEHLLYAAARRFRKFTESHAFQMIAFLLDTPCDRNSPQAKENNHHEQPLIDTNGAPRKCLSFENKALRR